ncbi:MAG: hypothetical protein JO089_08965 [Alphaproteobacteria bacterium]|nr:hypothetical protein [Alphaproteobacteria bacterium]
MRAIFFLLLNLLLLAATLATGVLVLLIAVGIFTALALYLALRQRLTGRAALFTCDIPSPPSQATIIEGEYWEIKNH